MPVPFEMPDGAPPIIPVVVIDEAEKGPALARALLQGGIQAIEVTLRTCLLYTSPSPRDS